MSKLSLYFLTNKKSSAFTLIELLVVLTIMATLSALTMSMFIANSNTRNAQRVSEYLISDIQLVRNKAMSGAQQTGIASSMFWSMRITCNTQTYELGYSSNAVDGNFVSQQIKTMESGFRFNCPVNTYIQLDFQRLTGQLDVASLTIPVTNANGTGSKTITVYKNGKVSL